MFERFSASLSQSSLCELAQRTALHKCLSNLTCAQLQFSLPSSDIPHYYYHKAIHLHELQNIMANHIASISSSSRAIRQHEVMEANQQDHSRIESASTTSHANTTLECSTASDLAKMSVLSLADTDCNDSLSSLPSRQSVRMREKRTSSSSSAMVKPDLLSFKLEQFNSIEDLDSHFDNPDLHHCNVLSRIEKKWFEISKNLDSTMEHLQDCSRRVTDSSSKCLEALSESVITTCDSVDDELKAFYHMMTKCDELTTKLSMATSFRDEIKTLRKSIETLEQLYKNKPHAGGTPARLPNRI